MRRIDTVYILGMMAFIVALTGCSTKDIAYDVNESADGMEETSMESRGAMLSETLGIVNNNWKENIETGVNTAFVRAVVEVPEVTAMYTQEVTEHYYTPEEQKKVAEYFMDADTIRVNKEAVHTREWVQERLDYFSRMVEPDDDFVYAYWNKELLIMQSNEKKRLESLVNEAPAMDDVSDIVKDYSENYYIGSKDSMEYTLSFDMDEETNTSSWTLEAVKYKTDLHETPAFDLRGTIREKDRKEACQKAEQLCRELGISGMKVLGIRKYYTINGYHIILVRNIGGIEVDNNLYHGDGFYLNTETTEKPYDREMVVVNLNNQGIISMTYQGCLAAKEVGNAVKLLKFDQVLESFRKELGESAEKAETWKKLSLVYARVADETNPNQYSYIPAWCLSTDELFGGSAYGDDPGGIQGNGTSTMARYTFWINAIDGSRIDPKQAGFIHYIAPEEQLRNDRIYFDWEEDDYSEGDYWEDEY